ncbi:uncharacterized protein YoxC [Paenibacillus shirakamiensis]|uniref:Uncharacterized protein YoxC n=1 Tax=Paenibacillus shirakamiensis TaxID=1265935 RepID=A0ABS4JHK1_9BACL|nr:hypothetical protein [Paenibacillus shirakamiensis]MBP2001201.1 uncharacterized protein YoxC [Paenibacillus shirakamiensis]
MLLIRSIRVPVSVTLIGIILLTTLHSSTAQARTEAKAVDPLKAQVHTLFPEDPQTRSSQTHGRFQMILVQETAALMHTTPDTFIPDIRSGKTLAQIVQAKTGWSESAYVRRLNQAMASRLDQAVASGKLSSDQVSRIKQTLPSKIKTSVTQVWQEHPRSKVEIHRGSNQINIRP